MLNSIISSASRKGKRTFLAFVDLRKAYDLVWREALWHRLFEKGIRGRILKMIMELYKGGWTKV